MHQSPPWLRRCVVRIVNGTKSPDTVLITTPSKVAYYYYNYYNYHYYLLYVLPLKATHADNAVGLYTHYFTTFDNQFGVKKNIRTLLESKDDSYLKKISVRGNTMSLQFRVRLSSWKCHCYCFFAFLFHSLLFHFRFMLCCR